MEEKQQFVTKKFRIEFEKFIILKYTTLVLLFGVIVFGMFQQISLMFSSFILMLVSYQLRELQKEKLGLI